jgi:hypothetical protein
MAIAGSMAVGFAFMLMRKMANRVYFMIPPFYYTAVCTFFATPIAIY